MQLASHTTELVHELQDIGQHRPTAEVKSWPFLQAAVTRCAKFCGRACCGQHGKQSWGFRLTVYSAAAALLPVAKVLHIQRCLLRAHDMVRKTSPQEE